MSQEIRKENLFLLLLWGWVSWEENSCCFRTKHSSCVQNQRKLLADFRERIYTRRGNNFEHWFEIWETFAALWKRRPFDRHFWKHGKFLQKSYLQTLIRVWKIGFFWNNRHRRHQIERNLLNRNIWLVEWKWQSFWAIVLISNWNPKRNSPIPWSVFNLHFEPEKLHIILYPITQNHWIIPVEKLIFRDKRKLHERQFAVVFYRMFKREAQINMGKVIRERERGLREEEEEDEKGWRSQSRRDLE